MTTSFHKSNLGSFSGHVAEYADMDGYVPTSEADAWDLRYDHGCERTHHDDGSLTEYGEWWECERFPEIRAAAIAATEAAEAALAEWRAETWRAETR